MNKKLIIGLFPVLMAIALPSLFLGEKGNSLKGEGNILSQLVSLKLSSSEKGRDEESSEEIQDIYPTLERELEEMEEQIVTHEMLDQALEEHGLAPALVYAFHGKSKLFISAIENLSAQELENLKDRYDAGVLHWGVMGGCLECVKTALRKGLNVNTENTRGETPLVLAISDGDFKMANFLISVGADPNVVANNVGYTLLMSASFAGLDQITGLIIGANGNLLASDEEGKTAIHYAAKEGHEQVVNLLVKAVKEKGLNLTTILAKRDSQGKSAQDYASDYGHEKVRRLLDSQRL